jgi:hypothetical protein
MSEAPKRIWAWWDDDYDVGVVSKHSDKRYIPHEAREYIRADLVEAAIKRALEGAANMIRDGMDDSEWYNPVRAIRALDPAQFIKEEKG